MMRRVVKVGGSLLTRPNIAASICRWIDQQTPAQTLVIVGGGEMIEAVRRLDRIHGLDATATHWICVDVLVASEALFATWVPDWKRIQTRDQFALLDQSDSIPILVSIPAFYHRECSAILPTDWRTTTDAIAGYLGVRTDADEVVLLKSCPVPRCNAIDDLAAAGIVDTRYQPLHRSAEKSASSKFQSRTVVPIVPAAMGGQLGQWSYAGAPPSQIPKGCSARM